MAEHWRPPERGQLGEWLLRAARGFTGRGNSALPVGDPGLSAAEALVVVRSWYAARDLPPLLALPSTAADPADTDRLLAELRECPGGSATGQGVLDPRGVLPAEHAELAELLPAGGWQLREGAGALVLTCATRQLHGPVQLPPGLELAVTDEPDPDWLGSYRYRGQQLPPIARRLLLGADQQAFVSIRDAARTVAVARGSLARGWAGLTAVEVLPEYRRRGLAGNLLRAVAEWAWRAGAVSMYLQVGDANPNAIRLYRSCGFVLHHRYDYVEAG